MELLELESALVEPLDEFVDRLERLVQGPLDAFGNANDVDERIAAAGAFSSAAIQSQLRRVFAEMDTWHRGWHNGTLDDLQAEFGRPAARWKLKADALTFAQDVEPELRAFGDLLGDLERWMGERADYSRRHTIAAGFAQGIGDVLSFFGGPRAMAKRGEQVVGSFTEADELDARGAALGARLEKVSEAFILAVRQQVVNRLQRLEAMTDEFEAS